MKIRRPSVVPLSECVDQFMRGLGLRALDMADKEARQLMRAYVERHLRQFVQLIRGDLAKGAERGVKQTIAFMLDPKLDQTRKQRREDRKARRTAIIKAQTGSRKPTGRIQ